MKIFRKLLGFFYRDLSAGHVTSFSKWLACWSVRGVALFYNRDSTELVSIWFVFQFYLALYLHVLYFYFSFHRSSWKNLCLSPTSVKKVLLELHIFKCDRWMLRRDWTLASTVVVVWVWITLDLEWIVDCPIFRFSYLWFQLGAIFLYLLVFLRMCFHSHWALCGEAIATIFIPRTRQLLTLKGTHGTSGVWQCSGQILARK